MTCPGWCCAAYDVTPLRPGEAQRIADYLEISIAQFHELYTSKELREHSQDAIKTGKPCPFWTAGLCAIQEVKPETCRSFIRECVLTYWPEREACVRRHRLMVTHPLKPLPLVEQR